MKGRPEDLAFDATLRAAAVHQRRRRAEVDAEEQTAAAAQPKACLLYTSPSPRDRTRYRMPSSA